MYCPVSVMVIPVLVIVAQHDWFSFSFNRSVLDKRKTHWWWAAKTLEETSRFVEALVPKHFSKRPKFKNKSIFVISRHPCVCVNVERHAVKLFMTTKVCCTYQYKKQEFLLNICSPETTVLGRHANEELKLDFCQWVFEMGKYSASRQLNCNFIWACFEHTHCAKPSLTKFKNWR